MMCWNEIRWVMSFISQINQLLSDIMQFHWAILSYKSTADLGTKVITNRCNVTPFGHHSPIYVVYDTPRHAEVFWFCQSIRATSLSKHINNDHLFSASAMPLPHSQQEETKNKEDRELCHSCIYYSDHIVILGRATFPAPCSLFVYYPKSERE